MIFETILVLICLLTTNDRAAERLGLLVRKDRRSVRNTGQKLLFPNPPSNITVGAILGSAKLEVGIGSAHASIWAEQPLGGLIDAQINHIIITRVASILDLVLAHHILLHSEIAKSAYHALIDLSGSSGPGRIWGISELRILKWIGHQSWCIDRGDGRIVRQGKWTCRTDRSTGLRRGVEALMARKHAQI